jgi:hypothetical protein
MLLATFEGALFEVSHLGWLEDGCCSLPLPSCAEVLLTDVHAVSFS